MGAEAWIIGGIIVISIFSILVYACLAVFYPEWVGITGKVALNAEISHREGETPAPHPTDKL
ncbi:hypothetical protein [Bdellovibrio sp. NC01]|uniref:hypothetical protein n=1 Tax=Bdellovibrio sp. NC01 TaxID=2220073 RepID=UPI00115B367E|nr:hypothetical protein [Bdellovibrio sp. NC01]QDK37253.1 hypothetical protein DOE51_06440 [Bdellovibrio sp. NC01]